MLRSFLLMLAKDAELQTVIGTPRPEVSAGEPNECSPAHTVVDMDGTIQPDLSTKHLSSSSSPCCLRSAPPNTPRPSVHEPRRHPAAPELGLFIALRCPGTHVLIGRLRKGPISRSTLDSGAGFQNGRMVNGLHLLMTFWLKMFPF
jgi:hypothetical protein